LLEFIKRPKRKEKLHRALEIYAEDLEEKMEKQSSPSSFPPPDG
jgi:hypothetical protein